MSVYDSENLKIEVTWKTKENYNYLLRPTVAALVGVMPLIALVTTLGIDAEHLGPFQLFVYLSAILATSQLFALNETLSEDEE